MGVMIPLLAETSDVVQIVSILRDLIIAIFGAYISLKVAQLGKGQKEAAIEVKAVKTDLQVHQENVDCDFKDIAKMVELNTQITGATHQLVNGGLGDKLSDAADDSEFRAMHTGDAGDIARAEAARAASNQHIETTEQLRNRPEPPGKT